jgi:anthranilate phosphoribosyltransferase
VFNILGPLSHPGRVGRQVIGTPNPALVDLIAETLANRGVRAWVVCGSDGLDEITTTGDTAVVSVADGELERFTISPREFGIPLAGADEISVGDPAQNASVAHRLLAGEPGPLADLVALNAAAALVVAEVSADLEAGLADSRRVMDDGTAAAKLTDLVALTQQLAT